jgi:hypothetical protein
VEDLIPIDEDGFKRQQAKSGVQASVDSGPPNFFIIHPSYGL